MSISFGRRRPSVRDAERQASAAEERDARDAATLAQLGYKQELDRSWGLIHNFGASFSIISVITGITTLFSYGLNTGGPATMSLGWIVVTFFTMFVALGMAEITSAHPTSGGPYFWAAMLAPDSTGWGPFFSWLTGWFNFLGQVAVTTGIEFGCATLISDLATIKGGYEPTPARTVGITAGLLVSHGLLNTFGVKLLRYLNNSSVVLHSLGVTAFAIAVVAAAPTHQSADFVFRTYNDGTAYNDGSGAPLIGWGERASPAYVVLCGLLMAQYTITGFDASAHMSEETRNADRSAPIGVLISVGCSGIFGWFLILCLLFSIQDVDATITGADTNGQPVLQILLDIFGQNGAIVLFTLLLLCVWHCGLFSLASNSRMMFAFARDNGIPRWFAHVDRHTQAPVRTIWLAALLSFCLALPSLGSSVAFTAATSIATIGLYISYALPILEGLIWHADFISQKGPFNLRAMSRPVALVACLWVGFIIVVFCLPTQNPVNSQTLNYTPVCVGIIALWTVVSWYFPIIGARRWFTGPRRQIEAEERGEDILADPGTLETEKDVK